MFPRAKRVRYACPPSNLILSKSEADAAELEVKKAKCLLTLEQGVRVTTGPAASLLAKLRIPNTDLNPILRFETEKFDLLVDTVTVLQAIVATERRTFEVLLSPFRELAVSAFRCGLVTVLDVDFRALAATKLSTQGAKTIPISRETALTFADWLPNALRMKSIAAVAQSIREGTELRLPHVGFPEEVRVTGWQEKGSRLFLAEGLKSTRPGSWWLGLDDVIVVLSRGTDVGWRMATSFGPLVIASEALFDGTGSLVPETLEPATIRRLREVLLERATH